MTTVVAVADERGVWMAADTTTNIYDRPVTGWARKIIRLRAGAGTALLGISGNAGIPGQVRRVWPDGLSELPVDAEERQVWAEDIASELTVPLVEAGMVHEGQLDGHLLLGVPGAVWTIQHHMAILCPAGRGAVGTGEGPAMGAVDAFLQMKYQPDRAVELAATIACARDRWSGLPLQLESIELPVPVEG